MIRYVLTELLECNAGINLTGYHPPPQGTPGLLHRNVCPAPGLLHNRKCPGAGPINDDVPGPGICINWLSNMKIANSYLVLKLKMSECPIGPDKVQKTKGGQVCTF